MTPGPFAVIPYAALPHPRELPVLGSTLRRFHTTLPFFEELKREHGDAVRFHMIGEKFLLFNHPALVNEVLVTKQSLFRKGRALENARVFLGNSLLVSEGAEHARQRRLIQPAFHRGRIAGYATLMAESAQRWTGARHDGESLDLAREMSRLTLDVVTQTLFGASIDGREAADSIAAALTVIVENFQRMLLPFWNVVRRVPLPAHRRLLRAQRQLDATIYELIARRRREGGDRGDLLSTLLAAEDAEDPRHHLSDTEVRDQAMTLFLAGQETTANALAWTWHLLSLHDEVRARLREEVLAVLGPDRLPTLDDTARLPFTTAVLSEAMRLYPPAWIVGRRAIADVTIGDYEVPARTIVLASQYLIQRDERFWPCPLDFLPERWLNEDAQASRPKFAYFPFGGGGRTCIGEGFAWTEGVILLAVIARRWRFDAVPGPAVEIQPTVTLRPKNGLPMIVREN